MISVEPAGIVAAAVLFLAACNSLPGYSDKDGAAPNTVPITARLVTSGQPSALALSSLSARGFQAVVYLAPPTAANAVIDEADIVGRQGISYVNIPVQPNSPTESDFEFFATVMAGLSGRKVLVHCQINGAASSMVFLDRAIYGKQDVDEAYQSVLRAGTPAPSWKDFMKRVLANHQIQFDPY